MAAQRHPPRPILTATLFLVVAFAALFPEPACAQELPKKDKSGASFDFEPKLMLNDIPDSPLPASERGIGPAGRDPAAPPTSLDVTRLESDLEKAKKTAAWRERLWKAGVLSKVEAEQGALRIVRLARDLETARLQVLTSDLEEKRKQAESGNLSKDAYAAAEAALTAESATAKDAAAKWDDAQRAAAELRVQRERKLLAVGAGSRSSVKRAEAALQVLATGGK